MWTVQAWSSSARSCTINDTWDCQKDEDCGTSGGTCDFTKVGGSTADSGDTATYDPECQPEPTTLECSEGQVKRCKDHPGWSCATHGDCGDCFEGARCMCGATEAGTTEADEDSTDEDTSPAPPAGGPHCCSWEPYTACGNPSSKNDWCDKAQANCEGGCSGKWKPLRNASPAPPTSGKCCWDTTCVGEAEDEWCGKSKSNCESDCDGKWK